MSGITCEHNMKERKEGLCSDCAKLKPYTVFKTCIDECFACNECGYFFGSGHPTIAGQPLYSNREQRVKKGMEKS